MMDILLACLFVVSVCLNIAYIPTKNRDKKKLEKNLKDLEDRMKGYKELYNQYLEEKRRENFYVYQINTFFNHVTDFSYDIEKNVIEEMKYYENITGKKVDDENEDSSTWRFNGD